MDNIRLIDKAFDLTKSELYILSIRFSPDGFSFLVTDPIASLPLALAHIQLNTITPFHLKNELNELLHHEPLLKVPYKKTLVSYCGGRYLISPQSLVSPAYLEEVFYFTFRHQSEEYLFHQSFPDYQSTITFGVPTLLKEFFEIYFSQLQFRPETEPLLTPDKQTSSQQLLIKANRTGHLMYLVAILEGKSTISNSFEIKDETDMLYYITGFAKQFDTKHQINFLYSGEFEPESVLFPQLKRYGLKPELMTLPEIYNRNYNWETQPDQRYFMLFRQSLCE